MWKFDTTSVDIIFVQINSTQIISGEVNLGSTASDLLVDTGNRSNDTSFIDQGLRIIDGSI